MYKYETHLHTKQVSGCATASGKYQSIAYKKAGYTGIIITDHFLHGSTCLVPKRLPWEERVEKFCAGYEQAKAVGDKIGLQVFFGWEETFDGQDFLIYGLDKEWLLNHPEVEHWTIQQQFDDVNKYGGMVIHAHPFRDRPYIPKIRLFPNQVNGVEIFNGGNEDKENQQAYMYAKQYHLPMTAGSDSHNHDIICSGIQVDEPLQSVNDYVRLIKNRERFELIYT